MSKREMSYFWPTSNYILIDPQYIIYLTNLIKLKNLVKLVNILNIFLNFIVYLIIVEGVLIKIILKKYNKYKKYIVKTNINF